MMETVPMSASLVAAPPIDAKRRTKKRSRGRRAGRVATCNDTTGHQALMALERRLKSIRVHQVRERGAVTRHEESVLGAPGRARPVLPPSHVGDEGQADAVMQRATTRPGPLSRPSLLGAGSGSGSGPAAAAATGSGGRATRMPAPPSGVNPNRPRFMKPLVARINAPTAPLTPSRPPARPDGAGGFISPRRPVSASMPRRPGKPSILKRRRTKSATTRKDGAAITHDFVPAGMVVSLPPLLPTHSLLADAYTEGYDCGATDSDIDHISEVDTDEEMDAVRFDEDGDICLGDLGIDQAPTGRPSVAVPPNFVKDMLVSLDDSLEETGFRDLLASAGRLDAATMAAAAAVVPEASPLNDSPTLMGDAMSPTWGNSGSYSLARSSSPSVEGFAGLPSLAGFDFHDIGGDEDMDFGGLAGTMPSSPHHW